MSQRKKQGWFQNVIINQKLSGNPVRVTGFLVGFFSLAFLATSQAAPQLAAHRATYDLSLHNAENDSYINDITGRMVFEMRGSECDGYSIRYRFVTQMRTLDGNGELTDLQSTTFEEPDGASYSFLVKTFVGEEEEKTVRGIAIRDANSVDVSIQKPEDAAKVLSDETIFPTQHLRKIIAAAESGEMLVFADVYDGSENGVAVYPTTAIIGKRQPHGEKPLSLPTPGDVNVQVGWPITLSYFEETNEPNGEQVPIYVMKFFLYENGVSADLILDYGSFAMKGTLRDLELLEMDDCAE